MDYRFVSGPLFCIRTTVVSESTLSLIGDPAALLSLLKEIVAAAFERVYVHRLVSSSPSNLVASFPGRSHPLAIFAYCKRSKLAVEMAIQQAIKNWRWKWPYCILYRPLERPRTAARQRSVEDNEFQDTYSLESELVVEHISKWMYMLFYSAD